MTGDNDAGCNMESISHYHHPLHPLPIHINIAEGRVWIHDADGKDGFNHILELFNAIIQKAGMGQFLKSLWCEKCRNWRWYKWMYFSVNVDDGLMDNVSRHLWLTHKALIFHVHFYLQNNVLCIYRLYHVHLVVQFADWWLQRCMAIHLFRYTAFCKVLHLYFWASVVCMPFHWVKCFTSASFILFHF